jgi:hypothetical protein
MAKSLLPFWRESASQDASAALFRQVLDLLSSLPGGSLAHDLLAPFGPHLLREAAAPRFVQLVERYGVRWSQELFGTWETRSRYGEKDWLPLLPVLCEQLVAGAKTAGRAVAEWLLESKAKDFMMRRKALSGLPSAIRDGEKVTDAAEALAALLQACTVLEATTVRDALLAFFASPEAALSLAGAAEVLQRIRSARTPASTRALGLGPLYRHVVASLEIALTAPPRSRDDWSIEPSLRCNCELCKELAAFLRSPVRTVHKWPLAKIGRAHIHQAIDGDKLPVSHVTTRRGSPFTLVLEKRSILFEQDAAQRARGKELVSWLRKNLSAFSDPGT